MKYLPLLALFLVSTTVFSAEPSTQHNSEMMQMPIIAPLFIQGGQFTSTITAVNDGKESTSIMLSLLDQQGNTLAQTTTSLAGHTQQVFQVADLLKQPNQKKKDDVPLLGSVEIMPDKPTVAAQLSLTYAGSPQPLHTEEEFAMPNSRPGIFRGVAANVITSPFVALKNTAQRSLQVTLNCVSGDSSFTPRILELKPGELSVTQPCNSAKSAIGLSAPDDTEGIPHKDRGSLGVSIDSDATQEELSVYGFSWSKFDGLVRMSSIFFIGSTDLNSSRTAYAGVAMGRTTAFEAKDYSSDLSITNFSDEDASVFITLSSTTKTGSPKTDNKTVSVPAMTTKNVSLSMAETDPELRNSIIVESSLAPGLLLTKLTSHAPGNAPILEYQPKDVRQKENSGLHPWSLSADEQSRLLLFNYTSDEQYFNVKIYADNVEWQHSWLLKPLETSSINIKQLVADQTSDDKGKKLPKTTAAGEIQWSTPGRYKGVGRMLVSDSKRALARNFSCGDCIVLCDAGASPNSLSLIIDGNEWIGAYPYFCISPSCSCKDGYSSSAYGSGYDYSWYSETTAIAGINGSTTSDSADFLGVGAGGTNGVVTINDPQCSAITAAPVTVQRPDHLIVQSDTTGTLNCSNGGTFKRRTVDYLVVDATGHQVLQSVNSKEQFVALSQNSCGYPITTNLQCTLGAGAGLIEDTLQAGCAPTPGTSCGFTADQQQWLWCQANGTSSLLGTPGALYVHNDAISIGGNLVAFTPGTVVPK